MHINLALSAWKKNVRMKIKVFRMFFARKIWSSVVLWAWEKCNSGNPPRHSLDFENWRLGVHRANLPPILNETTKSTDESEQKPNKLYFSWTRNLIFVVILQARVQGKTLIESRKSEGGESGGCSSENSNNTWSNQDRLTSSRQTTATRNDSSDWTDSKEFEITRLQV